jgi:hypothetical protein
LIERGVYADLRSLRTKPKDLDERIKLATQLYPCDILFIHRDAEKEPLGVRLAEVRKVDMSKLGARGIPVIPIRMTEAWFLHDEDAIRRASGNPHGRTRLNLPRAKDVEHVANPKATLFDALLEATELTGNRREKSKRELPRMRLRVADLIDDFEPLIGVPAFDHFLKELDAVLQRYFPVTPFNSNREP